jgi:hypothetical protein
MTQTQDALARLAAAAALLGTAALVCGQTATYFVDSRAPAGGDGLSWATAYRDLRDVLDTVLEGDIRVYIAGGTYKPDRGSLDPEQRFSNTSSAVTLDLRGSCAGLGAADPFAVSLEEHPTILSGDLRGDDGPNWTNRSDNAWTVMQLSGYWWGAHHLSDLVIEGASAGRAYNYALAVDGQLVCNRCVFRDNSSDGTLSAWFEMEMRTVTLRDCLFTNNSSASLLLATGGTLERCRLVGNRSQDGFWHVVMYPGPCDVRESIIANNWCIAPSPYAAGLNCFGSSSANISSSLIENSQGIALAADYGVARIVNSTLIGGTASAPTLWATRAMIANSVVWPPVGAPPVNTDGSITASYSLIRGGMPGVGNLSADPAFVDPAGGDYRLRPGSPAIDAGSNPALLVLEGDPFDAAGLPRFRDDIGTPDSGIGIGLVVDIGAYEFQGTSCYADCDRTGALNVLDFNCFLNRFTAGSPWANCDNSSAPPILNVLDFTCFINRFTAGCP